MPPETGTRTGCLHLFGKAEGEWDERDSVGERFRVK